MRRFIIDTDCGSDDAVALTLALFSEDTAIEGITTVWGNVPLPLATKNTLMTLEVCGSDIKVYEGAARPLFREPVTAVNVHGNDGMGDCNLIHPTTTAESGYAVDYIIEKAKEYAGELELVTLGPLTNIAAALFRDPDAMRGIKRIWSMATAGFGRGNITPVSEFNVYADAEAFARVLSSDIPITVIGFDLCLGRAALTDDDLRTLLSGGAAARFAVACNKELREYNIRKNKRPFVDLPDAVAMGVVLWDDIVTDSLLAHTHCCTEQGHTYGQAIIYDPDEVFAEQRDCPPVNSTVIREIDQELFKSRMIQTLLSAK